MSEKLDLDALERALIGSAMGLTFRECQALIKYARALESRASNLEEANRLLHEQLDTARATIGDLRRASNAGGAVAWAVPAANGGVQFGPGWMFSAVKQGAASMPLYRHPAPASKEPVADERAALTDDAAYDIAVAAWKQYSNQGYSPDGLFFAAMAVRDATRAALATAQADQWVPVVHGDIPDKGTPVIAWHEDFGAITIDAEYLAPSFPEYTHWMPLPAAPAKPEGGNV